MTPEHAEEIRSLLMSHRPAKVHAWEGGAQREIPVQNRKKKWEAVLGVLRSLEWTRIELLDKGGALLAVIKPPPDPPPEPEPEILDDDDEDAEPEPDGSRELALAPSSDPIALMRLMLLAQREVLQHRDREVKEAIAGCVQVMREMGSAVATMSAGYQDVMRSLRAQAAQAAQAPTVVREVRADDGDDDDQAGGGLLSVKMLEAMLPQLLTKMMAPSPPAPTTPTGGSPS